MSDARNDGQLLTAHLGGDAGAFEALTRRHAAMVLGVTRRLLGPGPDAEDAAQATFMLLARKSRSLAGARELGAWLHRSARLVARTALRAQGRRARHEREAAAMRLASEKPQESKALTGRYADRMDEALDSLPESYRQALLLCYFEGLSQKGAAQRLAVPESTLSSRCTRGLEKLRARLGAGPRSLGAAALGALLVEGAAQAAGSVPESFVPSVVSAANGAAAGAPILALTEGALKAMFWIKMKVAAAVIAATVLVAVATPFAVRAASGEPAKPDPGKEKKVVKKEDKKKGPVAVDGLRLTLAAVPGGRVCSDKCRRMFHLANGIKKCPGCGKTCNVAHKWCPKCADAKGACEVCGKKMPAEALKIKELKAGVSHVKLLLTFENVSKGKIRIFTPLTHNLARSITIKVDGPGVVRQPPAITRHIGGALPMLRNYPELAPGGKTTVEIGIAGNPPQIRGWDLYLTRPGT